MEWQATNLDTLATLVPGGFYWKDSLGTYLGCNDNFLKAIGLTRDEVIGKKDNELWPTQAKILEEHDKIVIKSQYPITLEEIFPLNNGEHKVLLVVKMPLKNQDNEVLGIIANSIDITPQRKKPYINEGITKKANVDNVEISHYNKGVFKESPRHAKVDKSLDEKNYILLVEDQSLTAEITHIILSDLNCQVDVATTAKSAIQAALDHKYDLIFMDVGLPDMDGYEATKQIRLNHASKDKPVPIIALTANADNNDRVRCIEAGMNAVLIKPLFKEKAEDMLNAFIPKVQTTQIPIAANDAIDWSVLPEKIIDLEVGARLFNGNVELAKKMLTTMLASFTTEIGDLDTAYKIKDWDSIEAIVHKLRGGISYCGAPRLQEACARFENHLKAGYRELAPLLYKQLLKEIEAVKKLHLQLGI